MVGLDAVQPIHDVVAVDFLQASRVGSIALSETSDQTGCSVGFKPLDEFEFGRYRFISTRLRHTGDPLGWQLGIRLNMYDDEQFASGKWSLYRFQVIDDAVVQAKKGVYVTRGTYEVVATDDAVYQETHSRKHMYERPLTENDCKALLGMMQRTIARAVIS